MRTRRLLPSPRSARLIAAASVALLASSLAVVPSAQADDASTLTVVGTSDVFDSNLVQAVIKPRFEAANPGITLNYVSRGTGAAIAYAQAGTASALIVHAAALENQFVANGYSAEPYGRAIFWGDYVLLGPASDPAGVLSNGQHDIATAFEKVAVAGAAGTANFVSRGGTPGTTVQEHAIWALTGGQTLCDVSAANGGGTSPATAGGACPSTIPYPSWYHATGLTQGPNILAGDACNFSGGGCYVFTDRGTFNYLQSTNQITQLGIVTRDNASNVRGAAPLLVNSFHAYAVSATKFAGQPNVAINSAGATRFLDWITSPEAQFAIQNHLNGSDDPPFLASAAPELTVDDLPGTVVGGSKLKVTGNLANVVPGTPALDGVTVRLMAEPSSGGTPERVASAKTDGSGDFRITYEPRVKQRYSLEVDSITKIEDATLNPVFGDILAPTSKQLGKIAVQSAPKVKSATLLPNGDLRVRGVLRPKASSDKARLVLRGGLGGKKSFRQLDVVKVKKNRKTFDVVFDFPGKPGQWKFQVRYTTPRLLVGGYSPIRRVTVR